MSWLLQLWYKLFFHHISTVLKRSINSPFDVFMVCWSETVWLCTPYFVFLHLNFITAAWTSLYLPILSLSFLYSFPEISSVLHALMFWTHLSIQDSWFLVFFTSSFIIKILGASMYPSPNSISPSPLIGSFGSQAEWLASVAHDPLWPWQLVISIVTDGWGVAVPFS